MGPLPCEFRAEGGGGRGELHARGWPSCWRSGRYSAEAQALDHKCSCCKEERTSRREVQLLCPDGSSRKHTYTHIESCLCQDTLCELPQAQRRAPGRARRSGLPALHPSRG